MSGEQVRVGLLLDLEDVGRGDDLEARGPPLALLLQLLLLLPLPLLLHRSEQSVSQASSGTIARVELFKPGSYLSWASRCQRAATCSRRSRPMCLSISLMSSIL